MSTRQGDAEQARLTTTPSTTRDVVAEIGIRLLDDAHMAWHQAELECEHALCAWCDATPGLAAEQYVRYRAALDREEAAARDLERLWEVARWGHKMLTGPNAVEDRCISTDADDS
jgi:hypothetical protein